MVDRSPFRHGFERSGGFNVMGVSITNALP
jgi:hypothetical protein